MLGSLSSKAQAIAPSLSANSGALIAHQPDSRGWTDPALNHNKLLQQQTGDGFYKLIGPYKVVGTQFLFGEHNKGDLFSTEVKAYNIYVSYNTYNQEVEFYSTSNPDKPLVRETGTLDSFIIQSNPELGITKRMKFVYGSLLGGKEKYYYQEIYKGEKYSLYKRYKSELGYVSTNIVQSELRQFDLTYDYYYSDLQKNNFKKLKTNVTSIIKEFKEINDISPVFDNDAFTLNQDNALIKAFEFLNK